MTDPDAVREQLRRLARGDRIPDRDRDGVIERAAEASCDVETAAAFVASGGRERLVGTVEADERDGNEARATRGRAVLARYDQFVAACDSRPDEEDPGGKPPDERQQAREHPVERTWDERRDDDYAGPLPPRSRNE